MERIGVAQRRARLGVRHHLAPTRAGAGRGDRDPRPARPARHRPGHGLPVGLGPGDRSPGAGAGEGALRRPGADPDARHAPDDLRAAGRARAGRAGRLHPGDRGPGAAQDRAVPGRGRGHRRPGALAGPGRGGDPGRAAAARHGAVHRPVRPRCPSWPSGSWWPAARRTRRPRASRPGCCRCWPRTGGVVRGRPRGQLDCPAGSTGGPCWTTWLPGGLPELEPAEAQAALARAWLWTFGPAPVTDLKWWSGWTLGQTRAALAAVGAVEVDLDGTPGVALPDDLAPVPAPEPYAALLPVLDPTTMGWQDRGWYLGAAREGAVRHQRQRRPDGLVGRPDRRRLGPAQVRRGRAAVPRGRRGGRGRRRRGAGRPAAGVAGPGPDHAPVPDAAGAGAGGVSLLLAGGTGRRRRLAAPGPP